MAQYHLAICLEETQDTVQEENYHYDTVQEENNHYDTVQEENYHYDIHGKRRKNHKDVVFTVGVSYVFVPSVHVT